LHPPFGGRSAAEDGLPLQGWINRAIRPPLEGPMVAAFQWRTIWQASAGVGSAPTAAPHAISRLPASALRQQESRNIVRGELLTDVPGQYYRSEAAQIGVEVVENGDQHNSLDPGVASTGAEF
jgi:hypothetical protein